MNITRLKDIAQALVMPGKGILAADESAKTIQKRLEKIGVQSTPETNLAYRKMLFTTPGIEQFISGVILYDETIRQETGGQSVPRYLKSRGILPGIKVDQGTVDMNSLGEKITQGLEGLKERLIEYKNMGAEFAKWRAVITIGEGIPSDTCIETNAESLAMYAALCQEQDMVPIVEPEVLMDGPHDLTRCKEATTKTIKVVFDRLKVHKILLEGMILKPNMVISGKEAAVKASPQEIARATVETFREVVPAQVPGIVFLSGGQTPDEATENLAAINRIPGSPWQLSFSYGRALQGEALKVWAGHVCDQAPNVAGKEENTEAAQKAFLERCQQVSAARSIKPQQ